MSWLNRPTRGKLSNTTATVIRGSSSMGLLARKSDSRKERVRIVNESRKKALPVASSRVRSSPLRIFSQLMRDSRSSTTGPVPLQ
jgi:hypothetical protein